MENATVGFEVQKDGIQARVTIPVSESSAVLIAAIDGWIREWKAAGFTQVVRSYGGGGRPEKVEAWARAEAVRPFQYESKGEKKRALAFTLEPEEGKFESREAAAFNSNCESILAKLPAPLKAAIEEHWKVDGKRQAVLTLTRTNVEVGYSARDGKLFAIDVRLPGAEAKAEPAKATAKEDF